MQDNVCYTSSDEVMKPGASGSQGAAVSDVYAAVDQKKLKPVSKPNEVYAEVHKPGNKKAKKEGNCEFSTYFHLLFDMWFVKI